MKCLNNSLPSIKLLLDNFNGNEVTVSKIIDIWDLSHTDESIPTIEEATEIYNVLLAPKQDKAIQSELDEVIKELEKAEHSDILKAIDEHYYIVNRALKETNKPKSKAFKKAITTESGINKVSLLQDSLKRAKNLPDTELNQHRQIRALAKSIVQMTPLLDAMSNSVKEIIQDKTNALDNIFTLQGYFNTIKDFETLLKQTDGIFGLGNKKITQKIGENRQKISQIERHLTKNDESGIMQALKENMVQAGNSYLTVLKQEVANHQKNIDRRKAKGTEHKFDSEQLALKEKLIKDFNFEIEDNILAFLRGERGDNSSFNTYMESFRDNTSPDLSAFVKKVNEMKYKAQLAIDKLELQFEKEVAPYYNSLLKRYDVSKIGKLLTFRDKRMNSKGEEYEILTFLNPWKNYQRDYQEKLNAENTALEIFNKEKSDESEALYKEARKERQQFEADYLHREFKSSYYDKFKLYDDAIGQELKKRSDEIWNEITDIQQEAKEEDRPYTEEEQLILDTKLREYKFLGKLTNLYGSKKEGTELKIAERMKEIRKINSEVFEYKPNMLMFEKAIEAQSDYLIELGFPEESPEYQEGMQKWLDANRKIVAKPEAYEKRQKLLNRISNILNRTDKAELRNLNVGLLWKEILDITYGLRDEDNIPEGQLFSENQQTKILIIEETIEKLKNSLSSFSGLTDVEQQEFSDLIQKSKDGTLDIDERGKLDNLFKLVEKNGLDEDDKLALFGGDGVKGLFEQLKELTSRIPTEYYIQEFNNLSSKYGVVLDINGQIEGEDVLNSPKLDTLLSQPDFKEWFEKTHIKIQKYNPETKQKEEKWQRGFIWSQIVFNEPDAYETTNLSKEYKGIGNSFKGIPSSIYSIRQVKPSYKTDKIIGETIDNRGNWLPKTVEQGAIDDKYVNEEYNNLKTNNIELFNLLQIYQKYSLKAQEEQGKNNKLWMDVPSNRKSTREKVLDFKDVVLKDPLSIPKFTWQRIKEKVNTITDFSESGDTYIPTYNPLFDGRYAKDYLQVLIAFNNKVKPEEVSLDLFQDVLKYAQSSALNRVLVDNLPIAKAYERIGKSAKKKNTNRAKAIDYFITRDFGGQRRNRDINQIHSEATRKVLIALTNFLKSSGRLAFITLNLPGAIANRNNAIIQNLINTGNSYYTLQDYYAAKKEYGAQFYWFLPTGKDYRRNKLGEKSLERQVSDVFGFVQGQNLGTNIGQKLSQSNLEDAFTLKWFTSIRGKGEAEVQSSNAIAILYATKIQQGDREIRLINAYELDDNGYIKLKEGIDPSWDVEGENFHLIREAIETQNRRIHGAYDEEDASLVEGYALGSLLLQLKKFFTAMYKNRMAYGDNIHTPEYNQSSPRYGYIANSLSVAIREAESLLNSKEFANLSPKDKESLKRTAADIVLFQVGTAIAYSFYAGVPMSKILLAMLPLYTWWGGDDEDEKDEEKIPFEITEEYPWEYWQIRYQLARLSVETSTFMSASQYTDFILKPTFIRVVEQHTKLLKDLFSGAEYQKDYSIYKEGDLKLKADIHKVTGVRGLLLLEDPDENVKAYEQATQRSR